ncbi:MAG: phosphate uptake regulator PhoU [Nitrososphaerota archaeon]|nr:phosphate uptake regulator PhoU [Candidatus Calditenuaceae archaeon]MDW8073307.1 phosphate uptake regulator PhoU [Nitrososphaerota archaeon]
MPVYSRKVQKTGGSTIIVSLPQEWVRRVGLRPHDELYLLEEPSGGLILWPAILDHKDAGEEVAVKVTTDAGPEDVLRLYLSAYIAGYNVIRLEFGDTGYRHTKELKEMMRRWLVGVEIVGESLHGIVTQCLPAHDSLQPAKVIERMADLAASMQRDALYAVENNDEVLAQDIVQRDYDVDRFYHFAVRQLNIGISSPRRLATLGLRNPQECLSYIIAAKTIERAADHATSIANTLINERQRKRPSPELIKAGYEASNLFTEAKIALRDVDISKARQVMRKIEAFKFMLMDILRRNGGRGEAETMVHALGESIRRIAEYSSDLCEVALNLGAHYRLSSRTPQPG